MSCLVKVHGDAKLIVKLERLGPDHPSKPEAVVAVYLLRLRRNIQDVLPLIQRPHILTCSTNSAVRLNIYHHMVKNLE